MKKFFATSSSGYTGRLLEYEILGECRVQWDGQYLPWGQAVWQVRKNQPWDTKNPNMPVPRLLLQAVKREMGSSDVEVYTSVGTALDRYHGVDGYFFFQGVMVTMDVTLRDKPEFKADLCFHEVDLDNLDGFAKKIAEVMRAKLVRRAFSGK
jgi:hypothetical protein